MNAIPLRSFGTSFASRERAREVAAALSSASTSPVTLDLSGALLSPSFLSEILLQLAARFGSVTLTGCDQHTRGMITRIVPYLGLDNKVQLDGDVVRA